MSLPSGYIRAEYIEFSGYQYIDTGFTANQYTRIIIDCQTPSPNSGGSCVIGSRTSYTSNACAIYITPTQVFYNHGTRYSFADFADPTERIFIEADRNTATFTGKNSGSVVITLTGNTFTTPGSLILGSGRDSGSIYSGTNAWIGKVYSCQIYDSETLVRNFIPCVNPSNIAGVYDDVNGKFYNSIGTGNLIAYMNTPIRAKVTISNSNKTIKNTYINIGGLWKLVTNSYNNIGGLWKLSSEIYTVSSEAEAPPVTFTYSIGKVSGASYGFSLGSDGYYESTNKAVGNSAALCRVTCVNNTGATKTITIQCINYAESNYDFGIIGLVNTALSTKYTADSSVTKSFKGSSSSSVQTVTINIPTGTNWFDIKYRKDNSVNKNNDSLKFKIVV